MKKLIGIFILGFIFFGFTNSLNAQTAREEIQRGDALLSDPRNKAYAIYSYNEASRIAAQNNDWFSMLSLANRFLLVGDEWSARQAFSLAFTYSYDMAISDPKKTGIPRNCALGRQGLLTVISFFNRTLSGMSKSADTQKRMEFDRNQAQNAINWLNDNYGKGCPGTEKFTINTTKTTYASTEDVIVNYSGMPGNNNDVITIVETRTNTIVSWFYTAGKRQGSVKFSNLPGGNYETHLRPSAGTVEALSRFTVKQGNPISAATTKKVFFDEWGSQDKHIVVRYSGIPDTEKYWIGIFKSGDLSKYVAYAYPESENGETAFDLLPKGSYEVHVIERESGRSVSSYNFSVGIKAVSGGPCRSLTDC